MRWFMIFAMLLMPATAQAVTVTNLSDAPQVLMLEQTGRHWQVEIAPKQAYRYFGGKADISLPGRTLIRNAEPFDFYTIWPDGSLNIQKRNANRSMAR